MHSTKKVARFGKVWQLLEYSGFRLNPICNLPFKSGDFVETDGHVVVGISGGSLIIFVIDDYLKRGEIETIALPGNFVAHSLVIGWLSERRIYIGGESGCKEGGKDCQSMYYVDLNSDEYSMEPFPLPEELKRPGKAIDDIGLYAYKIYVLDNIILPKYLYIFSVKNLELLEVVSLNANGTYESYYRIAINFNYIVMLSNTVGDRGRYQHLSFYSRENPKLISTLTFPVFNPAHGLNNDLFPRFNDLLLVKDNLVLAASESGMVVFDLSQEDTKELLGLDGEGNVDDFGRVVQKSGSTETMEYLKSEYFSRPHIGEAVSVEPLLKGRDDLDAVLVTIHDRDIFRSELINMSR